MPLCDHSLGCDLSPFPSLSATASFPVFTTRGDDLRLTSPPVFRSSSAAGSSVLPGARQQGYLPSRFNKKCQVITQQRKWNAYC
ncbi:hypothetical protein E2C01_102151 [Portunus trituberculatus]|uniref:Uncharacterized protein n=1 Tax=Portunus trituberculatus TaxID=210409 RepID=A0A5B7KNJ7_PORTR|nr:hypothetical protein [Portunus trituberculatus]